MEPRTTTAPERETFVKKNLNFKRLHAVCLLKPPKCETFAKKKLLILSSFDSQCLRILLLSRVSLRAASGGPMSPHPLIVENIIVSGIWGAQCLRILLLSRISLRAASGALCLLVAKLLRQLSSVVRDELLLRTLPLHIVRVLCARAYMHRLSAFSCWLCALSY